VYRPLGVEDQLLFVLPGPPSPAIAVAVNRTERDFTCRDRTVLNVIRPHLVRAYRNAEVFCRLRLAISALEAAVDERGEGLAVVDQRGRVEFATRRAATLLQCWFGPQPEPDLARLLSVDRKVLTSTALGKGRLVSVQVVRGSVNGARWRLLLAEQSAGLDSPRLDSLGLTRREGDVLALVASGYTNAEVARRLCVQPSTVRKHLEHVYAKLGVQNRTAAARIALQTCAVVGSDGSARSSLGG
jgi:DNA-binding CsgD family transcriptional regulator